LPHLRLPSAPDVPPLGDFRGLHFDERGLGEAGEPAGDLRLAHAGRTDEDDVVGDDLLADLSLDPPAPPAIAQRDGDHLLGRRLADHVLVELGHDLARRQLFDFLLRSALPAAAVRPSRLADGLAGLPARSTIAAVGSVRAALSASAGKPEAPPPRPQDSVSSSISTLV